MRIVDLRGRHLSKASYQSELPRADFDVAAALESVQPIIAAVRDRGLDALDEFAEKFDGIRPPALKVPREVIDDALLNLDPPIRTALEESIRRVRIVHRDQERSSNVTRVVDGGEVEERWIPVDRVGLYVPGGRAVYPSSVVMNVVPAQIAGVPNIAIVSPPQKENSGWPHPTILAAAALLGIDSVFAVGGAQAIAALAFGIKDGDGDFIIEPVDLVSGPGNIYVAAAKRALRGVIGIDSEAGPTEIAIVADESASPIDVAADLISQAEHDTIAAAVLITDSPALAEAVQLRLPERIARTKHSERISIALSGKQSAIVLVDDEKHAIEVANAYAAEHLELLVRDPKKASLKIRNAGAVFLGRFSPVSLGDYSAGSNHVLPTGGCACHSSGLSVQTFLKGLHFINYSERAFREIAPQVVVLANSEDLPAHGEAMTARFEIG